MLKPAHTKNAGICAFCSYWSDKDSAAIEQNDGDFWQYETAAKNLCAKRDMITLSGCRCFEFQPKV